MALKLSSHSVNEAMRRAHSALAQAARHKEKAQEVMSQVTRTAVVGGAAFAMGLIKGKYGGFEVVGVPGELAVGLVSHLAGFAGLAGKFDSQLHSVGDGALASYFSTLGHGVGAGMLKGASAGAGLPDDVLRRMTSAT